MKFRLTILIALATALSAQRITDTRTASIRGGGGDGKCTVEVDVDDVADVEISGNRAQVRTLSGAPAGIRRFECNQELPSNPNDFRFQGVDGRGRQTLSSQPNGRRPAVIRIEDSKGGRENYTFDIFWRGGGGGFGNGNGDGTGYGSRNGNGNGNNDGYGNRNGNGNSDGYGNRNGNGSGNGSIFGNGNGNGNGNGVSNNNGWNSDLNFNGRGDGTLRSDRNGDLRLFNCRVSINRRGNVDVSFDTDSNSRLTFVGRVQRMDGDRIIADMNGNNIGGQMEIEVDSRNRVRSIFMQRQNGRDSRDSYELNWRN